MFLRHVRDDYLAIMCFSPPQSMQPTLSNNRANSGIIYPPERCHIEKSFCSSADITVNTNVLDSHCEGTKIISLVMMMFCCLDLCRIITATMLFTSCDAAG